MRSFVFNKKYARESLPALLVALAVFVLAGCATTGLDTADTSPGDENIQQSLLEKEKASGPLTVSSIDVMADGKILIATSRKAEYTAFTLTSPLRLVVDIPEAELYSVLDTKRVNNEFVKTINVVTYGGKEKIGRVILELKEGVDHEVSQVEDGVLIRLKHDPLAGVPQGSLGSGGEAVVVASTGNVVPADNSTDRESAQTEPLEPATSIKDIQSFTEDSGLTIEIGSDGAIGKYNTFELSDPARVVIDVWDVINKSGLKIVKVDGSEIKDVRVGNHPDKVRFVIDLVGEEIPRYVITKSGDHITVAFGAVEDDSVSGNAMAADTSSPADESALASDQADESLSAVLSGDAEADAYEENAGKADQGHAESRVTAAGFSNVAYNAGEAAVTEIADTAVASAESAGLSGDVPLEEEASALEMSNVDEGAAAQDAGSVSEDLEQGVVSGEEAVMASTEDASATAASAEETPAVGTEELAAASTDTVEGATAMEVSAEEPSAVGTEELAAASTDTVEGATAMEVSAEETPAVGTEELALASTDTVEGATAMEVSAKEPSAVGTEELAAASTDTVEDATAMEVSAKETPVEVAANNVVSQSDGSDGEVSKVIADTDAEINDALKAEKEAGADADAALKEEGPGPAETEASEPVAAAPQEAEAVVASPAVTAGNNIRNIEYKKIGDKGFLTIETTVKPVYTLKESKDHKTLVLDINDSLIDGDLVRTLDATKLGTPVATISSYQGSTSPAVVRVLVDLAAMATHSVVELDGTLNLVFAPVAKPEFKKPVVKSAAADALVEKSPVYTGKKIDIDMMDARITDILRLLAEVSNLNIIASDEVKGTISLRLRDVPWDQAFDIILQSKGLDKIKVGNVIRVAPAIRISQERDAILASVKASEKLEPLSIEFVAINYAKADELAKHVKNVLSDRGSVTSEQRTNTLIVKDIKKGIRDARALVSRLDTAIPQVLIEARIVEASSSFSRDLGIQWGADYQTGGNVNANIFGSGVDSAGAAAVGQTPPTGANPAFEARNGAQNFAVNLPATGSIGTLGALGFILGKAGQNPLVLDLRLSAGEQEGQLRTISRPRVVTMDNKEAKIEDGESVPFETTSASGTSTIFIDANLSLTVTPHITPDGSVLMKIKASKNSIGTFTTSSGEPSIVKKEASTEVLVSDGETTVIGGIISSDSNHTDSGIPYLKDIPLVGKLFKSKSTKESQKELLIFITPNIMKSKRTG